MDFLQCETEQSPVFEHPVISATGNLATMRTVDPQTFVEFKRWIAEHARHREPVKRRRDLHQATMVQELLDEGLLTSAIRIDLTKMSLTQPK